MNHRLTTALESFRKAQPVLLVDDFCHPINGYLVMESTKISSAKLTQQTIVAANAYHLSEYVDIKSALGFLQSLSDSTTCLQAQLLIADNNVPANEKMIRQYSLDYQVSVLFLSDVSAFAMETIVLQSSNDDTPFLEHFTGDQHYLNPQSNTHHFVYHNQLALSDSCQSEIVQHILVSSEKLSSAFIDIHIKKEKLPTMLIVSESCYSFPDYTARSFLTAAMILREKGLKRIELICPESDMLKGISSYGIEIIRKQWPEVST